MNISELARQLNTEPQMLREKLPELGFSIGERAIQVDEAQVDDIMEAWQKYKKREKLQQKVAKMEESKESTDTEEKTALITLPPSLTVSEFAKKIDLDVSKVILKLMQEGVMAAMNEKIDYETAHIVAEDFGIQTQQGQAEEEDHTGHSISDILSNEKLTHPRPPVVVVMGHVDHGKTTLLDAIRKTNVVDTESGAITQHIGAYQVTVQHPKEKKDHLITFIDTPGHEAFRGMRSRGGQVADIAILVIAADDKIQPQTLESINIIQQENVPMIVAINKVDKPDADVDRIKTQLAEINLNPEDWGGKTITIELSAKSGTNIDTLLETILLVADLEELKANPAGTLYGTIIESHIDKGLGPVATALIQNGTLRVGDIVVCCESGGRVKRLEDYRDQPIKEATPSTPVKILGLKCVPHVGDPIETRENLKEIKKLNKHHKIKMHESAKETKKSAETYVLPIIIKTDVLGTLEALIGEISQIKHLLAHIQIIKKALGDFTENDALEAESQDAILIGFKVKATSGAKHIINTRNITCKTFTIIYELIDYLKESLEATLPPEIVEEEKGEAEVKMIFGKTPQHLILGGVVTKDTIPAEAKLRIFRNGEVMGEGEIIELQSNKTIVKKVREPQEFGIKMKGDLIAKEGDTLKFFTTKEKKRTL